MLALAAALVGVYLTAPSLGATAAAPLTLCGNPGPAPPIQHVIVVVFENQSHRQVVGNSSDAPYINSTLTTQCGWASNMFGATHFSAPNYLALTSGQYPPESVAGCGSVSACNTPADNVFHQTEANGLSWKAYQESMPAPCSKTSSGNYSLGHNPPAFYDNLTSCATYDVPVADLTAPAGEFWNDLQNRTLPSLSFVTPNDVDNGHDDGTGVPAIDDFLSQFVPLVQQSASYQDGSTAMLITFDEGGGGSQGQDCTDQALDLAGKQESCHIPFFVISPYTAPGPVAGSLRPLLGHADGRGVAASAVARGRRPSSEPGRAVRAAGNVPGPRPRRRPIGQPVLDRDTEPVRLTNLAVGEPDDLSESLADGAADGVRDEHRLRGRNRGGVERHLHGKVDH